MRQASLLLALLLAALCVLPSHSTSFTAHDEQQLLQQQELKSNTAVYQRSQGQTRKKGGYEIIGGDDDDFFLGGYVKLEEEDDTMSDEEMEKEIPNYKLLKAQQECYSAWLCCDEAETCFDCTDAKNCRPIGCTQSDVKFYGKCKDFITDGNPIFMLPGVMGSQLQASFSQPVQCPGNEGTFNDRRPYSIWIRLKSRAKCAIHQLAQNPFKVSVRTQRGYASFYEFRDQDHVHVIPHGGYLNLDAVRFVARGTKIQTEYYHSMAEAMIKSGYAEGINLFGAPYDWRWSPANSVKHALFFQTLFLKLNSLGKPSVMVAHSMGNLLLLQFIKDVEIGADWLNFLVAHSEPLQGLLDTPLKRKQWLVAKIHRFVSLGAPFIGAPSTYEHLVSGTKMLAKFFNKITQQDHLLMARSTESLPRLVPITDDWDTHTNMDNQAAHIGVTVAGTYYNHNNFTDLLRTLQGIEVVGGTMQVSDQISKHYVGAYRQISNPATSPGVNPPDVIRDYQIPMIIYYGTCVDTPIHYTYTRVDDAWTRAPTRTTVTNGDGTVPNRSSLYPKKWTTTGGAQVTSIDLKPTTKVEPGKGIYFSELPGCRGSDGRCSSKAAKRCGHVEMVHNNRALFTEILKHSVLE